MQITQVSVSVQIIFQPNFRNILTVAVVGFYEQLWIDFLWMIMTEEMAVLLLILQVPCLKFAIYYKTTEAGCNFEQSII